MIFSNKLTYVLFLLFFGLVAGDASARQCKVLTLDWTEQPFGTVQLSSSYTVEEQEFTFSVSGNTLAAQQVDTPVIAPFYQGDRDSVGVQYIIAALLTTLQNDEIKIDIDAGEPGIGVDHLNFKLFDVDGEVGRFLRQEQYEIRGRLNGAQVEPILILTNNMQTARVNTLGFEPVATEQGGPGLQPTEGVLSVYFPEPVDRVEIIFSINNGVTPRPGSAPGFGIDQLNFCRVKPVGVPTMSEWALITTATMLGFVCLIVIRRKKTAV